MDMVSVRAGRRRSKCFSMSADRVWGSRVVSVGPTTGCNNCGDAYVRLVALWNSQPRSEPGLDSLRRGCTPKLVASPTNPIPMRKHTFFEGPHGLAI
jgi:hypothetical protein